MKMLTSFTLVAACLLAGVAKATARRSDTFYVKAGGNPDAPKTQFTHTAVATRPAQLSLEREVEDSTSLPALSKNIEDSFKCPITMGYMTEPVMAADGHTYERAEIEQWFDTRPGRYTSPKTGARLAHRNTLPNHALRTAIQEYIKTVPADERPEPVTLAPVPARAGPGVEVTGADFEVSWGEERSMNGLYVMREAAEGPPRAWLSSWRDPRPVGWPRNRPDRGYYEWTQRNGGRRWYEKNDGCFFFQTGFGGWNIATADGNWIYNSHEANQVGGGPPAQGWKHSWRKGQVDPPASEETTLRVVNH